MALIFLDFSEGVLCAEMVLGACSPKMHITGNVEIFKILKTLHFMFSWVWLFVDFCCVTQRWLIADRNPRAGYRWAHPWPLTPETGGLKGHHLKFLPTGWRLTKNENIGGTHFRKHWLGFEVMQWTIVHHHHYRLSSVFHATHRLDVFPQSSSSNSFSEPLVQETLSL